MRVKEIAGLARQCNQSRPLPEQMESDGREQKEWDPVGRQRGLAKPRLRVTT